MNEEFLQDRVDALEQRIAEYRKEIAWLQHKIDLYFDQIADTVIELSAVNDLLDRNFSEECDECGCESCKGGV